MCSCQTKIRYFGNIGIHEKILRFEGTVHNLVVGQHLNSIENLQEIFAHPVSIQLRLIAQAILIQGISQSIAGNVLHDNICCSFLLDIAYSCHFSEIIDC